MWESYYNVPEAIFFLLKRRTINLNKNTSPSTLWMLVGNRGLWFSERLGERKVRYRKSNIMEYVLGILEPLNPKP